MATHNQARTTSRIQVILHRALVEMRTLTASGRLDQAHDLADTVEFLPLLVLRWDEEQASLLRPALLSYEEKYPTSAGRYTCILDTDEETFQHLYCADHFAWDMPRESQSAAG